MDVETRAARTAKPISVAERCERGHAECVRGHERCVEAARVIARARTVIARSHEHFRQYQSDVDRFWRTDSDEHDVSRAVVISGGSDDTQAPETAYLRARARDAIVSGKLSAKTSYRAEDGPGPGGTALSATARCCRVNWSTRSNSRKVPGTWHRPCSICTLPASTRGRRSDDWRARSAAYKLGRAAMSSRLQT